MNSQPKIVDVTGTSNILDFSYTNKTLIYSLGSLLISHNIITNTKTFINFHQSKIQFIKLINNSSQLISIDKNTYLVIWDFPSFKISISFAIDTRQIEIEKIFCSQMRKNLFCILLSSVSQSNLLYEFNSDTQEIIMLSSNFAQSNSLIYDFGIFYNSNDLIIMQENLIQYYHLGFNNSGQIQMTNNIRFPFTLIKESMTISNTVNLFAFLTETGNCLIYDQNGNAKPSIIPTMQEMFTTCEFSKDSLLCGTDNGKIYGYSIFEYKMKYVIDNQILINFKQNFLLGNVQNQENVNETFIGPSIDRIFIDEQSNIILLKNNDNSILVSPIIDLFDNKTDRNVLYFFSHYNKITHIVSAPLENDSESLFYSSSCDQSIQMYISNEFSKISNYYYDIEKINNKSKNNFENNKKNKTYINVLKFHPMYSNKLFAGDNKGALYLFDTKEKVFQYKKNLVGTIPITFISFNPKGNLMCVGFDTGMNIICDLNNECEYKFKVNEHFLNPNEIEERKNYHQIMSFSFFLSRLNTHNNINDNVILYMKSLNSIEIASIHEIGEMRMSSGHIITIKNNILDLIVHSSENNIIALIEGLLIVIHQINNGEVSAIIDLQNQVNYAYNIAQDPSGLYLSLICDVKEEQKREKMSNLLLFEIGTGKVECLVNNSFPMNKCVFDNRGLFLGVSSKMGNFVIWQLQKDISTAIWNVMEKVKSNPDFWDQYEIRYDSNENAIENYYYRENIQSNLKNTFTNKEKGKNNNINGNSLIEKRPNNQNINSLVLSDNEEFPNKMISKDIINQKDLEKEIFELKDINSIHSKKSNVINYNDYLPHDAKLKSNSKNIFEQNLQNADYKDNIELSQKKQEEDKERIKQLKEELMNPWIKNQNKQNKRVLPESKSYLQEGKMPEFINKQQSEKGKKSYYTDNNIQLKPHNPYGIMLSKVNSTNNMNSLHATKNTDKKLSEKQESLNNDIGQNVIKDNVEKNIYSEIPLNVKKVYQPPQLITNKIQNQTENALFPKKNIKKIKKDRYEKISKAITEMLSESQKRNKDNNINQEDNSEKFDETITESIDKIKDLKLNENMLKFSKQTFSGVNLNTSTEFFINNSKPINSNLFINKKQYPEPDDIDNDLQDISYNNLNKEEKSFSDLTSTNNINQKSSLTEDIEYVGEGIQNFEKRHHIH